MVHAGRPRRIGQGNNAFIFPGVGLGALVAEAREVTDGMFRAAAESLADEVRQEDMEAGALFPPIAALRPRDRAHRGGGRAPGARGRRGGRRAGTTTCQRRVAEAMWEPHYHPGRCRRWRRGLAVRGACSSRWRRGGRPRPGPPDIRFRDRVDVESVVVDARVVDGAGRPIRGLTPSDFRLKVDGRVVPVQSVTWVDESAPPDPETTVAAARAGAPLPPRGRLIVFFFQKDLEPSRVMGFLQMLRRRARHARFAGHGGPRGRRVVRFPPQGLDRLHRPTARGCAGCSSRSVLFERVPLLGAGDAPSLVEHLEPGAGKRAAAPETALLQLGQAMKELPGSKSLVLFGWGMGRWSPGIGVFLERDYGPARRALVEGRVTVFALDVTNADYHTLEVGLEQVAEDTGGFYAKTHLFPSQAIDRLERALEGHYVLTFTKPALEPGEHDIDIALVGRKGTVLARPSYIG